MYTPVCIRITCNFQGSVSLQDNVILQGARALAPSYWRARNYSPAMSSWAEGGCDMLRDDGKTVVMAGARWEHQKSFILPPTSDLVEKHFPVIDVETFSQGDSTSAFKTWETLRARKECAIGCQRNSQCFAFVLVFEPTNSRIKCIEKGTREDPQQISLSGQTATQVSTSEGRTANLAIDGNGGRSDHASCSQTSGREASWWQVTLPVGYIITSVKLTKIEAALGGNAELEHTKVKVGNYFCGSVSRLPTPGSDDQSQIEIDCSAPQTFTTASSVLRLYKDDADESDGGGDTRGVWKRLTLCEVEVFGLKDIWRKSFELGLSADASAQDSMAETFSLIDRDFRCTSGPPMGSWVYWGGNCWSDPDTYSLSAYWETRADLYSLLGTQETHIQHAFIPTHTRDNTDAANRNNCEQMKRIRYPAISFQGLVVDGSKVCAVVLV